MLNNQRGENNKKLLLTLVLRSLICCGQNVSENCVLAIVALVQGGLRVILFTEEG